MKENEDNNQKKQGSSNDTRDTSVAQNTSADQGNITEDGGAVGVGRTAGTGSGSDLTTKKTVTGSDFDGQAV